MRDHLAGAALRVGLGTVAAETGQSAQLGVKANASR